MNNLFFFLAGSVFGVIVILFLWIHDNEKKWRPPDEMLIKAWMIATRTLILPTGARKAQAIREALTWFISWREALSGRDQSM